MAFRRPHLLLPACALWTLACVLFTAAPAQAGRRVLTAKDLGSIEDEDTTGIALNDHGQIVGVVGSGIAQTAFLLDAAGLTDLGPRAAVDINNAGQVLLQTVVGNPDDPTFCLVRQPDGTLTTLDTPPGSQCFAADLNDRGQVVGSIQRLVGTQRVTSGFLWDGGVLTDLGTLGGDVVLASGVNENGQVVGTSVSPSGYEHAFSWMNGVMTDLGAPGGLTSRATAVNDLGQVALTSGAHVYLWADGVTTDLGTMGRPDVQGQVSIPIDLNERGQVLVAVYDLPSAGWLWGIWSAGAWKELPSLGGGVVEANRINRAGQVIGADRLPGSSTSRLVFWSREVVRGRRR